MKQIRLNHSQEPSKSIRGGVRPPFPKADEIVRRHSDNILTYYQHPVTKAMSEGLNSKIQKIKGMAGWCVTDLADRPRHLR